jgi:hypothetical protein
MDVLDITAPEIRAKLLRLQSKFRDRKLRWDACVALAYNKIARLQVKSGISLCNQQLREIIPGAVFEAALQFGWIENPFKRIEYRRKHIYRPHAFIPQDGYISEPVAVDIPDQELTMQLGRRKVTPQCHRFWLNLLEGPIAYWEAVALTMIPAAPTADALHSATAAAATARRRRGFPANKEDHLKVIDAVTPLGEDWIGRLPDACRKLHEIAASFPRSLDKFADSWEDMASELTHRGAFSPRERVIKYIRYRMNWFRAKSTNDGSVS